MGHIPANSFSVRFRSGCYNSWGNYCLVACLLFCLVQLGYIPPGAIALSSQLVPYSQLHANKTVLAANFTSLQLDLTMTLNLSSELAKRIIFRLKTPFGHQGRKIFFCEKKS